MDTSCSQEHPQQHHSGRNAGISRRAEATEQGAGKTVLPLPPLTYKGIWKPEPQMIQLTHADWVAGPQGQISMVDACRIAGLVED
eukprot:10363684-Karenia_brevis.AAC.1